MTLVSFDPVEGLMRLQGELDRFFGKPLIDLGLTGPNVFPLLNVFTHPDALVVRAEVPGIKAEQIRLQVEPGRLTVAGERAGGGQANLSYHRRERGSGTFSRTIQLPRDLDTEHATADCRNGLLTVRIPRQAAAKPRHIEIRPA